MRPHITDIDKIRKTRRALRNILRKIDSYLASIETVPARLANTHLHDNIAAFSVGDNKENYELIHEYESQSGRAPVLKYFDSDFFKITNKQRFTMKDVTYFSFAILATRTLISEEMDYIDVNIL